MHVGNRVCDTYCDILMEEFYMSLFGLNGRVAIITGGNGGIGLGMALGLANSGASIAIVGRNSEKNKTASKKLEATGANVIAIEKDVTNDLAGTEVATEVQNKFGRIDICLLYTSDAADE